MLKALRQAEDKARLLVGSHPIAVKQRNSKVAQIYNYIRAFLPKLHNLSVGRPDLKLDPEAVYKKERGSGKEHLYMVVIGHVDAGKSTLMGRLLCELGQVLKSPK